MTSLPVHPTCPNLSLLSHHQAAQLHRHNLHTIEDTLLRSPTELGYYLQLAQPEVRALRTRLAAHLAAHTPKSNFTDSLVGVTAHPASHLALLPLQSRLPLGDPLMDRFLRGGLPWPAVVELAGPAGAGKSQVCFQLMAQCLASFPSSARIVHVSTYSTLPVHRILQILPEQTLAQPNVLDRIVAETISDIETLVYWLTYRLPLLFSPPSSPTRAPAPLLVLDSITPLLRGAAADANDPTSPAANPLSIKQRHALMADLARTLHKLAHVYHMCVVVVNQAAADPVATDTRRLVRGAARIDDVGRGYLARDRPVIVPGDALGGGREGMWRAASSGARKVSSLALAPVAVDTEDRRGDPGQVVERAGGPALGLEWARMVRHRLYLARPVDNSEQTESSVAAVQTKPSVREMYVLAGMGVPNSLEVPERKCVFEIREHGLVGLEE